MRPVADVGIRLVLIVAFGEPLELQRKLTGYWVSCQLLRYIPHRSGLTASCCIPHVPRQQYCGC